MTRFLLTTLIVCHMLVVVGNAMSFIVLPFFTPPYVALPLMSMITLITFSRQLVCPLTRLENYLRRQIGLPQIGGFISHYMVKPIKRKKAVVPISNSRISFIELLSEETLN